MTTRRCIDCREVKPVEAFYVYNGSVSPYCYPCHPYVKSLVAQACNNYLRALLTGLLEVAMGGETRPVGYEHTMKNGFIKVKQHDGSWPLKHHLVAEQMLGRKLAPNERVQLKNSKESRRDPKPEDITIVVVDPDKPPKQHAGNMSHPPSKKSQMQKEIDRLHDLLGESQDQIEDLKQEILRLQELVSSKDLTP